MKANCICCLKLRRKIITLSKRTQCEFLSYQKRELYGNDTAHPDICVKNVTTKSCSSSINKSPVVNQRRNFVAKKDDTLLNVLKWLLIILLVILNYFLVVHNKYVDEIELNFLKPTF